MTAPRLISLCSPAMGSGKSTVAEHLASRHNFVRIAFAIPLKKMTEALFRAAGMDPEEIQRHVYGDLKETMIPALGTTSRRIQQTLGTEWGRDLIKPTLWTDIALDLARLHLDTGRSVVIDDMRFPNEFEAVTAAGGTAYRIVRPDAVLAVAHASEGQLDLIAMPEIWNGGSRDELLTAAERMVLR